MLYKNKQTWCKHKGNQALLNQTIKHELCSVLTLSNLKLQNKDI